MKLQTLESAFTWIWHSSWRACVLIVAVLIVQALAGRRMPSRFRFALSLLVMIRLLMPVMPASSWSIFNVARHAKPAPAAAPILPSAVSSPVIVAHLSNPSAVVPGRSSQVSLGQWVAVCWLCGGTGFLLMVLWRHRKFSRWVAHLPTATDPRLLELVEQCKNEAGLRCAVRIVTAPQGKSAAVFGFYHPCLLLPEGLLDILERREARLVLLHELSHIRRRDVLVNWISVLALALHWFNPLAWVAMRRLRTDQELACDAAVLASIDQAERGSYGRTLLKHLQLFPAAWMAAGLAPLITSRNNIKRRIIMITEFKNTGVLARSLFALLCVALGGLTFTRAAEDPSPGAPNNRLPRAAMPQFPDANAATPSPKVGQDYGAEYVKESTLLEQLNEMDRANHPRFIQALSSTASDPILNLLLQQELAQETRLASLKRNLGPSAPQMQEETAVLNDLKEKIDQRANGIIAGMSLQVAALKAAANDGLPRVLPSERTLLSRSLEDWDHQRVMAKADYLEYSNILANLTLLPTNQLGGALQTAYAHQNDPELVELAATLRVAKERMVDVSQSYGPDMPAYKSVKKLLEQSEAAYQHKIDAVMAGIATRVNEDKGLLQLIEQEERTIEEIIHKQQDDHKY
jgi:beta-lactamase regulating signal transducer with metallopeptidase domain